MVLRSQKLHRIAERLRMSGSEPHVESVSEPDAAGGGAFVDDANGRIIYCNGQHFSLSPWGKCACSGASQ